jgi:hypothetical protein
MHIETLRKRRKGLARARREIKAKMELLDELIRAEEDEAAEKERDEAFAIATLETQERRATAIHNAEARLCEQFPVQVAPEMLPVIHEEDPVAFNTLLSTAPTAPVGETKFGFTVGETVNRTSYVVGDTPGIVVGFGDDERVLVQWPQDSTFAYAHRAATLRHGA